MRTKERLDSDRHLITFNEGSRDLKDSCQQEERRGITGHSALFGEAGPRKSGMDLTRLFRPSCPCVPRIDHAARVAKRAVLLRDGFLPSEGASPESGFRRRRRIPGGGIIEERGDGYSLYVLPHDHQSRAYGRPLAVSYCLFPPWPGVRFLSSFVSHRYERARRRQFFHLPS